MDAIKRLFWSCLFWIRVVMRGMWCFTMINIFIFAYLCYILPMLPFRKTWPRFYWGVEGKMYRWLMACVGYWGYTAGYDVIEYGDDTSECEDERALVICNHLSSADVPTLMAALQSKGPACRKTLWVMWAGFRWTPFGMVGRVHGDHFIDEGRDKREHEIEKFKKHMRSVFWDRDRRWVIVFPEGGFLKNRIESSKKYAAKNDFPNLEYTTLPRIGAVRSVLETVGPRQDNGIEGVRKEHSDLQLLKDTIGAIREKKYVKETRPPIKYVLDVTIGYPDGVPLGLSTLCLGTRKQCDICLHYKVHKVDSVPFEDDVKLRDWLFERFMEKEKMLEHYYKTGDFSPGEIGRRLHFPLLKILIQYLFWFGSAYMQCKCYCYLINLLFNCVTSVLPF